MALVERFWVAGFIGVAVLAIIVTGFGQTRIDLDKQVSPSLKPGANITFTTAEGVRRIHALGNSLLIMPPTPQQQAAPCHIPKGDPSFIGPGTMALEPSWLWICAPVGPQDGEYRWKKIPLQ